MGTAAAQAYFSDPDRYCRGNHRIAARAEIVREWLGDFRGELLDLGCGDGSISAQFHRASLTLVDSSPAMLGRAGAAAPGARLVRADLCSYEGPPADLVLAIGILAHVPSAAAVMAAVARNLRPGGACVLQFSDADRLINRFTHRLLLAASRAGGLSYARTSGVHIRKLASEHGLTLVEQESHLLILPGMSRLLGRFLLSYDRRVRRTAWLERHASETLLLLRRA